MLPISPAGSRGIWTGGFTLFDHGSSRGASRKWLGVPLIALGLALALAAPASAKGGKIPITPGNDVPVSKGREIAALRYDESTCTHTTSPADRAAAILLYNGRAQ